jgi:hypothetical protein
VDPDQRHVVGVGIAEEQVDLAASDLLLESGKILLEVVGHRRVGLGLEHRGELAGVSSALGQGFPRAQVVANPRGLLVERCRVARVVPEIRSRDLLVELGQTDAFPIEVKDAPGALLYGRRRRWRVLQARSSGEYSTMQ